MYRQSLVKTITFINLTIYFLGGVAWSSGQRRRLPLQGSRVRNSPSPIFFCLSFYTPSWELTRRVDKKQTKKRRTSEPEPAPTGLHTRVEKTGLHIRVEETGLLEGREKRSVAATVANPERRNMKKDKMVRRSQETWGTWIKSIKWSTPSMRAYR